MERLADRWVERQINQLFAGEDMRLAHQTDTDGLMHHRIDQKHIVRLERDDRLESGFPEELVGEDADAVAWALQDERRVLQIFQADALLPGERVGSRKRDEQFLVGHRDIRRLRTGCAGTEGDIDRTARNGTGLVGGIKFHEAQGDIRIPPGKRIVNFAINGRTTVRSGRKADAFASMSGDLFHRQEHPVLFVENFLGALDDVPPHRRWIQAASVPQEQRGAECPLTFAEKLAQCRRREVQRGGRIGEVAVLRDGGKIVVLFGVHTPPPFLQYSGSRKIWQETVRKVL